MIAILVKILGFTNIWYKDGFVNAKEIQIEGEKIKVFDLPYLIATKIEAFKGRGNGEFLVSHDIEDIITLIDGRPTIAEDLKKSDELLKDYLQKKFTALISNRNFIDSIDSHISDRMNLKGRKEIIISRLKDFIQN